MTFSAFFGALRVNPRSSFPIRLFKWGIILKEKNQGDGAWPLVVSHLRIIAAAASSAG